MMSDALPKTPIAHKVLALIPAWNEAPRIGRIVEGARAFLPVLVVDDGSTDGTAEVARAAGATVVQHPRNRGKGAALKTGFAWALEHGYDAVLTLDADGQHDPAEIPKFLAALEAGAGALIIGRREFRRMPWPRWWSTPLGTFLLSLALGRYIPDNQSGYRLITRQALEAFHLTTTGFEMEVEMIAEAVRLGLPIGWVPDPHHLRDRQTQLFSPRQGHLAVLRMVWWIGKRRRLARRSP